MSFKLNGPRIAGRRMITFAQLAFMLVLTVGLALPDPAAAYIGPGAGLGAIAVTVALVLGVLLLLVGVVWYPLKRMLKGRKSATDSGDGTA